MICKVDREATVSLERMITSKVLLRTAPVTAKVSLQEMVSVNITQSRVLGAESLENLEEATLLFVGSCVQPAKDC